MDNKLLSLEEAKQYAKHLWGEEGDAWYENQYGNPVRNSNLRRAYRCAVGTSKVEERKFLFFRWHKRHYDVKGCSSGWPMRFEDAFRRAEDSEKTRLAINKPFYKYADKVRKALGN